MMDSSAIRRESLDESTSSKRVSRRVKRRSSRIDEESEIVSFGNDDEEDGDQQQDEVPPQQEEPDEAEDNTTTNTTRNATNRPFIRRSSSSFGSNRRPKLPDRFPRRLTNPLIDDSKVTNIQDLLRLTDELSFHRPDTYSISYHARVLGLKPLLDEITDHDVVGVPQLLERLKTPLSNAAVPLLPDTTDGVYDIPEPQIASAARVFCAPDDDSVHVLNREYSRCWDAAYHKLLRNPVIQTMPMSELQMYKCLKIVNGLPQNTNAIRDEIIHQFSSTDATATTPSEWLTNKNYFPYEASPFDVENASTTPSGWIAIDTPHNRIADAMLFQLEWFGGGGGSGGVAATNGVPILRWLVTSVNPILNSLVWQQARLADIHYTISSVDVSPAYRATKAASGSYIGDFRKTSPTLLRVFRPEQNTFGAATASSSSDFRRRWIARLPREAELLQGCGPGHHFPSIARPRVFSNSQQVPPTAVVRLLVNVETGIIQGSNDDGGSTKLPATLPPLHVLRDFALPAIEPMSEDEIKQELIKAQDELRELEGNTLEPIARAILTKVVQDRLAFEDPSFEARETEDALIMEQTKDMIEERKKSAKVEEERISMDMEAVCVICDDGNITPNNQIIFCESCNVAVHQRCYGIEKIPSGDFHCVACRTLGRDQVATSEPLTIRCELCPLPGGAFVKTAVPGSEPRWVHVVCAKWSGLEYVDREKWESIEDVTQMKINFRRLRIKCELCLGERGAMVKCTGAGLCKKWFHVTCARASGKMKVTHGENCNGGIGQGGWTLSCAVHTNIEIEQKNIIPVETMIKFAKELPPEPVPPPEPRPFNLLNGADRNAVLADPKYENALMAELLQKRFYGVRCEICDTVDEEKQIRCTVCLAVFCSSCRMECDDLKKSAFKCVSCRRVEALTKEGVEDFETPKCCVCVQIGGPLRPAFAIPRLRLEFWNTHEKERLRSYFGREAWTHTVCSLYVIVIFACYVSANVTNNNGSWLPSLEVSTETGLVDMSNAILNDGKGMVTSNNQCLVCGITTGVKSKCSVEGCCVTDNGVFTTLHITCARQCGLEVSSKDTGDDGDFIVHCYRHCGNEHNLRAKLEDMLEIEKRRVGKDLARSDAPMSFADGSRILHSALYVMRILGWAWRWAEWWVDHDSSWEPLLEPGQKEENFTKEELKYVESTRQQRCDDARRCRLAAFGAALRNREYDTEDDFKRDALEQELRAVLHTKTLVGPMTTKEIDFFVEWLSRAYRSKSRLLFMGSDRSKVSAKSPYCWHAADHTPKYELGRRPLPGAGPCVGDGFFEARVNEPDNFMLVKDDVLERHRQRNVVPLSRIRNAGPRANRTQKSPSPQRKPSPEKARAAASPPPRRKTAENVTEKPRNRNRSRDRSRDQSKGGSKKRAATSPVSMPLPKPATDDYLTRTFKARSERRATYESRTSTVAIEPAITPTPAETSSAVKKRRGRPPKRKLEDVAPEVQTGNANDRPTRERRRKSAKTDDPKTGTPSMYETKTDETKTDELKAETRSTTQPEAPHADAASTDPAKKEGEACNPQSAVASTEVAAKEDSASDPDDVSPYAEDNDGSNFSDDLPDSSFDVAKTRSRRKTNPLKLDETSGKTDDTNESEDETSSTTNPRSPKQGARRKTG
jgi:PHD-zinc-finger like domain/PHD-finger